MRKYIVLLSLFTTSFAHAEFGINFGIGAPYVSQYGVNATFGTDLSLTANYNILALELGTAEVELSMPEVTVNWHPFSGSFFLGFGIGSQSLDVSATDVTTSLTASAEVNSTTTIAKLGWMWGKGDGGFWGGIDLAFISPTGSDITITAPGLSTTSEEYQDVEEAAENFAETAYINLTFIRLGYLF